MINFIIGLIFYIILGLVVFVLLSPVCFFLISLFFNIKKNDKNLLKKQAYINIIFTYIAIGLLIAGITPISETMTCNEDLSCNIKTEYIIPISNKTRKINLNKDSTLSKIEECFYTNRRTIRYTEEQEKQNKGTDLVDIKYADNLNKIVYYLSLKDNNGKYHQIFKSPSANNNRNDPRVATYESQMVEQSIVDFQKYIKNPEQKFYIKSMMNRGQLNSRLFWWNFIVILFMFLFFNYSNNGRKK